MHAGGWREADAKLSVQSPRVLSTGTVTLGPGAWCVCLHILPLWKTNPKESKHSSLTFLVLWRGMVTLVFIARKISLLMCCDSVSFEPQQPGDVRSSSSAQELLWQITEPQSGDVETH